MVTDDFRLILIDLGHAEALGTSLTQMIGTPAYRAPEISKINSYRID